jgi:hypothetical protein
MCGVVISGNSIMEKSPGKILIGKLWSHEIIHAVSAWINTISII